jgi:hypothetical protein
MNSGDFWLATDSGLHAVPPAVRLDVSVSFPVRDLLVLNSLSGAKPMWRATIMAIGLCLGILGAECMVVDRVVLADTTTDATRQARLAWASSATALNDMSGFNTSVAGGRRIFEPPEWAPWGLLSAGALTFLYSTALPAGGSEE